MNVPNFPDDELQFTQEEWGELEERVSRIPDEQRGQFYRELGIMFDDSLPLPHEVTISAISEATSKQVIYEALEKYNT